MWNIYFLTSLPISNTLCISFSSFIRFPPLSLVGYYSINLRLANSNSFVPFLKLTILLITSNLNFQSKYYIFWTYKLQIQLISNKFQASFQVFVCVITKHLAIGRRLGHIAPACWGSCVARWFMLATTSDTTSVRGRYTSNWRNN